MQNISSIFIILEFIHVYNQTTGFLQDSNAETDTGVAKVSFVFWVDLNVQYGDKV